MDSNDVLEIDKKRLTEQEQRALIRKAPAELEPVLKNVLSKTEGSWGLNQR